MKTQVKLSNSQCDFLHEIHQQIWISLEMNDELSDKIASDLYDALTEGEFTFPQS